MVYSAEIKRAVGLVREALRNSGITLQSGEFREHGNHTPHADSPLVLVACSGGRDSMALAYISRIVCSSIGVRCGAVVVDHHLQEGSAQAAHTAARQCTELGLEPVIIADAQVQATGLGEEADARDARFDELIAAAHKHSSAVVLLAHTSTDQAETVAIGLLRAPTVSALAGMPSSIEKGGVTFLRPFLKGLARQDTTRICENAGISWWDDPTNAEALSPDELSSGQFPLRSRIRQDLMPYLAGFARKDISGLWSHYTDVNRQDRDYIDSHAAAAYRQSVREYPAVWDGHRLVRAGGAGGADTQDGCSPQDLAALGGYLRQYGLESRADISVYELLGYSSLHPAIRSRILIKILESRGIRPVEKLVSEYDDFLAYKRVSGPFPRISAESGHPYGADVFAAKTRDKRFWIYIIGKNRRTLDKT